MKAIIGEYEFGNLDRLIFIQGNRQVNITPISDPNKPYTHAVRLFEAGGTLAALEECNEDEAGRLAAEFLKGTPK